MENCRRKLSLDYELYKEGEMGKSYINWGKLFQIAVVGLLLAMLLAMVKIQNHKQGEFETVL